MVPEEHEALRRLRAGFDPFAARALLRDACVVAGTDGALRLQVRGAFERRRLEQRHAEALRRAFGGPVEVVTAPVAGADGKKRPAMPHPHGPRTHFAIRVLRAFVDRDPRVAPLVVLHGPADSGKSALLEWVAARGGRSVFRLDLERLRRGHSRGLVPRKPLVIADGVERLARGFAGQRSLCGILEAVLNRGDRVLVSVRGHPAECAGFDRSLRTRLLGGVLVPLGGPGAPASSGGAVSRPGGETALLDGMKTVAARLFEVERELLDGNSKRRRVVEARRTVIAAARAGGLDRVRVAEAFGLRSQRAVREACRWARLQAGRDSGFVALLHEVGRVIPGQ